MKREEEGRGREGVNRWEGEVGDEREVGNRGKRKGRKEGGETEGRREDNRDE